MATRVLHVRLDEETVKRLDKRAAKERRARATMAALLIKDGLKDEDSLTHATLLTGPLPQERVPFSAPPCEDIHCRDKEKPK